MLRGGKDPIITQYRELMQPAGRRERGMLVVEDLTVIERAHTDGLPLESVLYTAELLRNAEGQALLEALRKYGLAHYRISDGLMGTLTIARPLPQAMAAMRFVLHDAADWRPSAQGLVLLVERVQNPDNLGMLLRTADAAGCEAVIVTGEGCDPTHRNCVRAARGAVGRLPILGLADAQRWLSNLRHEGIDALATSLSAAQNLYDLALPTPIVVAVGNETHGLSNMLLEACSQHVRIPMAPGQDSLNVGVAAGIVLYEIVRQRSRHV